MPRLGEVLSMLDLQVQQRLGHRFECCWLLSMKDERRGRDWCNGRSSRPARGIQRRTACESLGLITDSTPSANLRCSTPRRRLHDIHRLMQGYQHQGNIQNVDLESTRPPDK